MKIKEILSQSRRDLRCIYVCEHCDFEFTGSGYDDTNFHQNVIPKMECKECQMISPEGYRGYAPKYNDNQQI
jgi:ribosomal protein L37AE/L43A